MKKYTILILALALTGCANLQSLYDKAQAKRQEAKNKSPVDEPAQPVTPAPAPTPVAPETADGIPAGTKWLHTDVSGWPVTTTLSASVSGGTILMPYDKAKVWPGTATSAGDGLNGNPWAIVNINGQWYAATFEWLRHGQTSKPVGVLDGSKGDHFKVSPLNQWRPRSGERFGIMVSGLARDKTRNVKERSNVSWVVWP